MHGVDYILLATVLKQITLCKFLLVEGVKQKYFVLIMEMLCVAVIGLFNFGYIKAGNPIIAMEQSMTRLIIFLEEELDHVLYAFEYDETDYFLIMKELSCSIGL